MKNSHKTQSGAVMITVLLLLVVITLMGLSSLKQGLYQTQMASAEVAYSTCFTYAESGLNAVYKGFQEQSKTEPITDPNNIMNKATISPQAACLSEAGLLNTNDECSPFSGLAQTKVSLASRKPAGEEGKFLLKRGTSITKGGYSLVYSDSRCELPGLDLAVTNTQAWQFELTSSLGLRDYTDY